jgi:NitT/TauT family transport system substrate-binding protein
MIKTRPDGKPNQLRRTLLLAGAATVAMPYVSFGQGRVKVRIGTPTKTYFPTIIVETAIQQKLFEKEGIDAELTVYRSGAEGFEALAAGAADVVFNSTMSVAGGRRKGVNVMCVANGANGYYGWQLVVKTDSPIKEVAQCAGKKVGITSAGSGTDILARWTLNTHKIDFTRVPVGGGGLVPNLLTGNIEAAVLYSPLSFQMVQAKQARTLIQYGTAVPAHSTGSWIATDRIIKDNPNAVQKTLNAIYGGVGWLRAPANRDTVIKFFAKINDIPEAVAAAELDDNIMKLSVDGGYELEWVERSLDMAKLVGMTDLAPAKEIYTTQFKPVPTAWT